MDARLVWSLGVLAVGAAAVGAVTIAASSQAAAANPAPASKACPAKTGVTSLALIQYVAHLGQGGTSMKLKVGDVLKVALLRSGASTWTITVDDDSVLQAAAPTTEADGLAPGGTDDVVNFKAIGTGHALVTATGGGGGFKLAVDVSCA